MATTSLNLLHLPFSKSAASSSSLKFLHRLPLKSQIKDSSNLLVCKGKTNCYNVEVVIEDDEPADAYVKIFEREVMRSGIPQEWRRRKFFESQKEELKRKAKDRSRSRRKRFGGGKGRESGGKEEEEVEEDPTGAAVMAKLMDPEYQEGNIEVLDEVEFPHDIWDEDGDGTFPVPI